MKSQSKQTEVKKETDTAKEKNEGKTMAELVYRKVIRVVEYYVLLSFILITFVPLLNFSWVPAFTKFIYMTGFPLLILLFLVGMVKEPILKFLSKILEK